MNARTASLPERKAAMAMIRMIAHLFRARVILSSFPPHSIDGPFFLCYSVDATFVSAIRSYHRICRMSTEGGEMSQIKENVSPMSNEGRNAYVIEHITDALLKLLREKPIEAISISELCGQAGIGRASFYRNFNSKEDILRSYIHGLFQEWAAGVPPEENRPLSELLRSLFSHLKSIGFLRAAGPEGPHLPFERRYHRALRPAAGGLQRGGICEGLCRLYAVRLDRGLVSKGDAGNGGGDRGDV